MSFKLDFTEAEEAELRRKEEEHLAFLFSEVCGTIRKVEW